LSVFVRFRAPASSAGFVAKRNTKDWKRQRLQPGLHHLRCADGLGSGCAIASFTDLAKFDAARLPA
jgi:hypothetical protein